MDTEKINQARKFFGIPLPNPFVQKDKVKKGLGGKAALGNRDELLTKAEQIIAAFDQIRQRIDSDNPFKSLESELGTLKKAVVNFKSSQKKENDKLQKAYKDSLDTLQKSYKEDLGKLQKGLSDANKQIEKLLNTPRPRKSFDGVEQIERFQKGLKNGLKLSLSKNKADISNLLFSKLEKGGGGDRRLESAIINLEAGSTLSPEIIELLAKEDNVIITN